MAEDFLDYGKLIDEAMHRVVKRALALVQERGLPLEHHFFITFRTDYPGVMLSDELRFRYPEEMTIVMQHQFWDLEVEEDRFSIVLSFDNVKQNLTIPFSALVSFADPSMKFGLQFHAAPLDGAQKPSTVTQKRNLTKDPLQTQGNQQAGKPGKGDTGSEGDSGGNNVVTLDSFRKKGKK